MIRLGLEVVYTPTGDPGQYKSLVEYVYYNESLHNVSCHANRLYTSVIAVHGIGAHPDRTWTVGDVNWLKDHRMLPRVIPNSRILRFGYESQWLGKEAIQQRLPLVADQLLRNIMAFRKVGAMTQSPYL